MSRSVLAAMVGAALLAAAPAQAPPPAPKPATRGAKPPMTTPVQTSAEAIRAAWDFNDPAASEGRFRAMLAAPRATGDQAFRLEVETQLARTFSLRGRYAEAHALLDGVERALAAGEPAAFPAARVRYLLERGRCFNSAKRQPEALPSFRQAWDLARAAHLDDLAVDAAHMVAIAEPAAKDQEAWNLKAIAHAEASADPAARKWLGSLLNNLGWTYHDAGRPAEALPLWEKALAWHRANKPGGQGEDVARWTVARCLRTLGRHEEALAAQQALQADMALAKKAEDGYVAEEIAENLLALGWQAEARPHFARAHALLSKDAWFVANEARRLARLAELGRE